MQFEGGKKTVCPFYLHESKYRLSCESVADEAVDVSLSFKTQEEKVEWQKTYCYSLRTYHCCPLVRLLEKYKYTESD